MTRKTPPRAGRGRPRKGELLTHQTRTIVGVPLEPDQLASLDEWRRNRSRAEHLRRYGLHPGPRGKDD